MRKYIDLNNEKVGEVFVNAKGGIMIYTGYRDCDGDFHLVDKATNVKKLYRSNGEHGGYTCFLEDEPEYDLVGKA